MTKDLRSAGLLLALILGGSVSGIQAAETDSEGYPVVYVCGAFDDANWQPSQQRRFTRQGDLYSLTLSSLQGEFKLTNDDWSYEFGVDPSHPCGPLSTTATVSGLKGGPNFEGHYSESVTISFRYTGPDQRYAQISFTTGGDTPVTPPVEDPVNPPVNDPEDENAPALYLRGTVTPEAWSVDEAFRFKVHGGIYSLTLPSLHGEFKISDPDWKREFGDNPTNPTGVITSSVQVTGVNRGPNFHAEIDGETTISFHYQEGMQTTLISISTDGTIIDPTPVSPVSGTLPVLYINVYGADGRYDNEIIDANLDHKNYFSGEYWLDLNGCEWLEELGGESIGSREEPMPLEIKARGNWTRRGFAKKPFKLKLGKKQSMLGMSKSKHYAILAHADDSFGYLRNFAGFNLGNRIGLPWTPSQQPVEVVMNGDYRGIYFLTESIRVGDGRVPVEELDDMATDPALISGGYLVELDNYDEENQIRMEEKGYCVGYRDLLRITFDTPEAYSRIQENFITDQFSAMNNLIGDNSDELWSYVDLDDAARYYLVEEIMGHTEAYHGSTYLFRDRGENQKWHFSPLWDFGNAYMAPANDFFYYHGPFGNTWVAALRQNETFNRKVAETWKWFMSNCLDGFYEELSEYAQHVKEAAAYDYERWHNVQPPYGGEYVTDNRNMEEKLNRVTNYLQERTGWLKSQFGDFTNGYFAEPERDATPAAPLPSYVQTGVAATAAETAGAEYFNLQGMKVSNPQAGEIYIVRNGGKTEKVVRR